MKFRGSHMVAIVGGLVFLFVVVVAMRERDRQAEENPSLTPITTLPQLAMEPEFIDLGLVSNSEVAKVEVSISNPGDAPLIIKDAKGSCACISGYVADNVVEPGDSTTLTIELDPMKIPVFETKKMMQVYTNDRVGTVEVVAKFEPEFSVEPLTLSFGEVDKGETVERTMVMRQLTDQPLEINDLKFSEPLPPGIEVSYEKRPESEWQTPGRTEYNITAKITPEAPAGPFTTIFIIIPNIERFAPGFRTGIAAQINTFYQLDPKRVIQLGRIEAGGERQGVVRVQADRPIKVTAEPADPAAMSASVQPQGDDPNTAVIDVVISPDAEEGRLKTRLELTVEGGGESTSDILFVYGLVARGGESADDAAEEVDSDPEPAQAAG